MKNNAERNKEVTSKEETTIVNGSREEHVEKQIKTPLVRRSSKGMGSYAITNVNGLQWA